MIRRKTVEIRVALALVYAAASFAISYTLIDGEFCRPSGFTGFAIALCRIAVALTLWDSFASAGCVFASRFDKDGNELTWRSALVSAFFVGISVGYLPYWIYTSHGVFRFEGTWADISCLFEEEVGFFFMFFGPFAMGILTLLRELLAQYIERRFNAAAQTVPDAH